MSTANEDQTMDVNADETQNLKAQAQQQAKADDAVETENKSDNISCCGSCAG